MLGISRQTDYAARLVLHLACLEEGAKVPIAEISRHRMLPVAFVRRIVGSLSRNGIVAATRGAGGGVRLGRPAAEISLLDILDAMEGGVVLNHCVDGRKTCPLASGCPVQTIWVGATRVLEDHLASIHFDALANGTANHLSAHLHVRDTKLMRPSRLCS